MYIGEFNASQPSGGIEILWGRCPEVFWMYFTHEIVKIVQSSQHIYTYTHILITIYIHIVTYIYKYMHIQIDEDINIKIYLYTMNNGNVRYGLNAVNDAHIFFEGLGLSIW